VRKSQRSQPAVSFRVIRPTPRLFFLAVFLACAGLLGFALYLQEQVGLDPCPMCILQRYVFVAIGLVALAGAIHGPRIGIALKVYGVVLALLTLSRRRNGCAPIVVATQSAEDGIVRRRPRRHPRTVSPRAGVAEDLRGFGRLLGRLVDILGLSIAEWAFVWFAIFLVTTIWIAFIRKPA
jgi:disulfide bond formation protein DsbB